MVRGNRGWDGCPREFEIVHGRGAEIELAPFHELEGGHRGEQLRYRCGVKSGAEPARRLPRPVGVPVGRGEDLFPAAGRRTAPENGSSAASWASLVWKAARSGGAVMTRSFLSRGRRVTMRDQVADRPTTSATRFPCDTWWDCPVRPVADCGCTLIKLFRTSGVAKHWSPAVTSGGTFGALTAAERCARAAADRGYHWQGHVTGRCARQIPNSTMHHTSR
jgi:hypothetical protein